MRADPRTGEIPVILLSARAGEESKVEGLDAGADDYLVKPFTARELLARVKAHLGLAKERQRVSQVLKARLADLKKANAEIREARRATLNVLEDTVESRNRAEQLYAELHERKAWLASQSKALQFALNGEPLENSLGVLVQTAAEQLGEGTRAAFYLADPEGTSLHHVVGMSAEYAAAVDGFQIGPESLACGLATHTGQAVLTVDVKQEPLWKPWLWLAERFDYRGCWSFPIHSSVGKFVGILAIYSQSPREVTQRELEFAEHLTQVAAIIISRHGEAQERKRAEEALLEHQQTADGGTC